MPRAGALLQPKVQPASWPAQPTSAPSATLAGSAGCPRVRECVRIASKSEDAQQRGTEDKTRIWLVLCNSSCVYFGGDPAGSRPYSATNMAQSACHLNAATTWRAGTTCGHFQTERKEARILSNFHAKCHWQGGRHGALYRT